MLELLSRLYPADLATLLTVISVALLGGLVLIVAQIIRGINRYREREIAAAVVAEMLDRGIASEEIIAVLKAMGLEAKSEERDGDWGCMSALDRCRRMRARFGLG